MRRLRLTNFSCRRSRNKHVERPRVDFWVCISAKPGPIVWTTPCGLLTTCITWQNGRKQHWWTSGKSRRFDTVLSWLPLEADPEWRMLSVVVSLESGPSKQRQCSGGARRGGKRSIQGVLIRRLIPWVSGRKFHSGPLGNDGDHSSEFFTPKRKLRHLSAKLSSLLAESYSQAINFPTLSGLPQAGAKKKTKKKGKSSQVESLKRFEVRSLEVRARIDGNSESQEHTGRAWAASLQPPSEKDKLGLRLCCSLLYDLGQTRLPSNITHGLWWLFYLLCLLLEWFSIFVLFHKIDSWLESNQLSHRRSHFMLLTDCFFMEYFTMVPYSPYSLQIGC